jgi:hypothetical protein
MHIHSNESVPRVSARQPHRPTPGRHKKIAGVALEPAVIDYLDQLAEQMRMNRSFVINSIVHEYARFIEGKSIGERVVLGEPVIKA